MCTAKGVHSCFSPLDYLGTVKWKFIILDYVYTAAAATTTTFAVDYGDDGSISLLKTDFLK